MIVPYGDSITTATGYSFPSEHTMNAATVYGGGALRKDLPRWLRIVLGVLVALVAFSRLFLGVHTPQDVVVGAAAGLLVMALTAKLTPQIKEWIGGPAGTMISCFVQMLYITFLFPWLMNTIEKRCA